VFFEDWPEFKDDATTKRYLDETLCMPVSTLDYQPPEPVFVLMDEAQTTKEDIFVAMASAYGSAGRIVFELPKLTPPVLHPIQRIGLFGLGTRKTNRLGCISAKGKHVNALR